MATSALNPHAPMFVPSAYRAVEDFSEQWWDLVHSTPCFRDYWLQECFFDLQMDSFFSDDIPDDFTLSGNGDDSSVKGKGESLDLVAFGWLKWRKPRGGSEMMPRYCEKAPKFVNMRVSPRPIQQPR